MADSFQICTLKCVRMSFNKEAKSHWREIMRVDIASSNLLYPVASLEKYLSLSVKIALFCTAVVVGITERHVLHISDRPS